jgi:hypothetical protein
MNTEQEDYEKEYEIVVSDGHWTPNEVNTMTVWDNIKDAGKLFKNMYMY